MCITTYSSMKTIGRSWNFSDALDICRIKCMFACPAVCTIYTIYSINLINLGSVALLSILIYKYRLQHKNIKLWLVYLLLVFTAVFNTYYHTDCGSGCVSDGTFFRLMLFPPKLFYPLNIHLYPIGKVFSKEITIWLNNLNDLLSRI